jgi:trans-AT polyketide synthase/acyltransferase/oxidoreductase domain-containing protein
MTHGPGPVIAARLGSARFRAAHGVKYAYAAGAMYKGIASTELVVALGRAGLIGFFGAGGLSLEEIEAAIRRVQADLPAGCAYGMNLLNSLDRPQLEDDTVALFLRHGVRCVEAAAFMEVSAPLVRYRLTGCRRRADGSVETPNRVLAKVSRPEVALAFLEPAPEAIVARLVASGRLSPAEAELAAGVPMADDICVEADSGGHTDQGVAFALLPAIQSLRDEVMARRRYAEPVRVGAAGGIGTPAAAAAAFTMGADFIVTGSINQCTVEAGISDAVKDMLQDAGVQDTDYAPAGDMFELGAKVQVLKKGLFFPARANKLYELYQRHTSLDEIDEKTRRQIEERYFRRSFDEVWEETKAYYLRSGRKTADELERHPKLKMALVFRWYFTHSSRLARSGADESKVDYQIHCGPAMGSFNAWVKGSPLAAWRNRHVADIGHRIMEGAAEHLNAWLSRLALADAPAPHERGAVVQREEGLER